MDVTPRPACLLPLPLHLRLQADNVVRLVNVATMKVECSVQGLRPPPAGLLPPAGVAGGAAALLPPGAGSGGVGGGGGSGGVLVVPAENAALQFYDVGRDRHMQLVQVGRGLGCGAGLQAVAYDGGVCNSGGAANMAAMLRRAASLQHVLDLAVSSRVLLV